MAKAVNKAVWQMVSVLKSIAAQCYTMGDGTTAGKVMIIMPIADQDLGFLVNGYGYVKAPGGGTTNIDDIFDCTAFTDLTATQFRKVLCLFSVAGAAATVLGTIATSQALAEIPDITAGYSAIGWLEANGVTDWDAVGGLAGEGVTYHPGYPLDK